MSKLTPAILEGDSRSFFQHVEKLFADNEDAYEKASFEAKVVRFWKRCSPCKETLVLACVVEAFAKLSSDTSIGNIFTSSHTCPSTSTLCANVIECKSLEKAMANPDRPGNFHELEVGAGIGSMAVYVVWHLRKLDVLLEYVFKDLSASYGAAAKRTFKNYLKMESTTLDNEKEPTGSCVHTLQVVISTTWMCAKGNLITWLTTTCELFRDDSVVTLAVLTQDMF
ncbi:putative polyketide synthase protein [Botrytis fragariae]|uniref:Putative polyketide synthase protein n=1 Tax=Botrytis fragariae TaxID=1964551 RepID=A0A8H6AJV6_9HELO|nr:putative polyketide synthase protein [Botrytis fragariae]KAF5868976.1 putative polyketide synthase protein [Botrytis fragariae]